MLFGKSRINAFVHHLVPKSDSALHPMGFWLINALIYSIRFIYSAPMRFIVGLLRKNRDAETGPIHLSSNCFQRYQCLYSASHATVKYTFAVPTFNIRLGCCCCCYRFLFFPLLPLVVIHLSSSSPHLTIIGTIADGQWFSHCGFGL